MAETSDIPNRITGAVQNTGVDRNGNPVPPAGEPSSDWIQRAAGTINSPIPPAGISQESWNRARQSIAAQNIAERLRTNRPIPFNPPPGVTLTQAEWSN